MKSSHTPGPWHIHPPQTKYEESTPRITSRSGDVCQLTVRRYEPDLSSNAVDPIELNGNTNLISAAPELLEACKTLNELSGENGAGLSLSALAEFQNTVFRLTSRAIAKAEGNA